MYPVAIVPVAAIPYPCTRRRRSKDTARGLCRQPGPCRCYPRFNWKEKGGRTFFSIPPCCESSTAGPLPGLSFLAFSTTTALPICHRAALHRMMRAAACSARWQSKTGC